MQVNDKTQSAKWANRKWYKIKCGNCSWDYGLGKEKRKLGKSSRTISCRYDLQDVEENVDDIEVQCQ